MADYEKLLNAAKRGRADAQFAVAEFLCEADPPQYELAAPWYRLAAEKGHAKAQNNLGTLYQRGFGIEKNSVEAVQWYRAAAEQGEPVAQYNLAVRYRIGEGVPLDLIEAARWLTLAAEQEYTEAMGDLGMAYRLGWGVSKDLVKAARYLIAATQQDDLPALYQLAVMEEELIHLAMEGDAEAMYYVAVMYNCGAGVPKNWPLARAWFRLAEEHLPESWHKTQAFHIGLMLDELLSEDRRTLAQQLLATLRSELVLDGKPAQADSKGLQGEMRRGI